MSQVNLLKVIRVERAMRLTQNRDQIPFVGIRVVFTPGLRLHNVCSKFSIYFFKPEFKLNFNNILLSIYFINNIIHKLKFSEIKLLQILIKRLLILTNNDNCNFHLTKNI